MKLAAGLFCGLLANLGTTCAQSLSLAPAPSQPSVGLVSPPVVVNNFWNGSNSNLWSGANWSPTNAGGATTTLTPGANVIFSAANPQNETTTLDVNETISSLVLNHTVPATISNPLVGGPTTLTIAGGGGAAATLTVGTAAGATTINSNLLFGGLSQGIDVLGANGLTVNGVISGTLGLTKVDAGPLTLTNANTYMGGTTFGAVNDLTAGTVVIGTGAAIPLNTSTNPTAITPFSSGVVTVNAPTTLTTDGATTANSYQLANDFILNPPLTVNVPTATTLTMSGNISGVDGLTVNYPLTFAGTLVLSGVNTYGLGGSNPSEQTNVDAGTLQAGSVTGFSPNSDFVLNNTTATPTTLDLAGFNNTIGSLNGGLNTVVTNSSTTTAILTLGGTPSTPAVSTFSGNLNDGAGILQLIKNDPNTLILNGGGSFSGGTTINAGKLAVGSAGALGNGFVANAATLETTASTVPAAAPESIDVKGSYSQTAAGTLLLQVATSPAPTPSLNAGAAGVNYDTLNAIGAASLAGILNLNFEATSVPSQGQRYVAVSAGVPLTSTFVNPTTTNLATFSPSFYTVTTYNDTFGGSEQANSAIVTLLKPFASFPGLTTNQFNVARNVDTNLGLLNNNGSLAMPTGAAKDFFDNIVTGLNVASYGPLGRSLDELSPQRYQLLYNVAFDNYAFDVQSLDSELARERYGRGGIDTTGLVLNDRSLGSQLSQIRSRLLAWTPAAEPGLLSDSMQDALGGVQMVDSGERRPRQVATTESANLWNAFIDGGVDLGDQDSGSDVSHASYTTGRVRGGVDFRVCPDVRVGALFGYEHTDADLDNEGSRARVDSYTPGLYAAYANKSGYYANALVTYTFNDYSTDRNIIIPGVNRTATGSTSGGQLGINLDDGYEFHAKNWTFGPNFGITYVNLGIDSFNENGAGVASLNLNDQSNDSLRCRLGGTVRYAGKVGSVVITPHASAFWQHEFLAESTTINSQFQGLPASGFGVGTTRGDRDNALLGFGIDADVTKAITLFVDYQAEAGGANFFGQSASGGVKVSF